MRDCKVVNFVVQCVVCSVQRAGGGKLLDAGVNIIRPSEGRPLQDPGDLGLKAIRLSS